MVSKCYFPSPFFLFKLLWVGIRITSFPLVNGQKPHHPKTREPSDFPSQVVPMRQHLNARSGSVPPHLAGGHPALPYHLRAWVSRYDKCALTLMPPEGPKRDNSPTAWPSKEQTLTKALTGDAIVPLSNSWPLGNLEIYYSVGERDKEIQDEAFYQWKAFIIMVLNCIWILHTLQIS